MKVRLDSSPEVIRLARQLGVATDNPVEGLLAFCDQRIRSFIRKFKSCDTLSDLLEISAQQCRTRFQTLDSSQALDSLVAKYTSRNEPIFAILEQEFLRGVLGITLRLQSPREWELPFVSVIDMRGDRHKRAYFTKWHEIAHLLLLNDEGRSSFRRTHISENERDAEEELMDIVAGQCGFHQAIIAPHAKQRISLSEIERLRLQLCPDSSKQAARFGFTAAWPTPVVLITCKLSTRYSDHSEQAVLRVVSVKMNPAAERIKLTIPHNMSVPPKSVISHLFGHTGKSAEAIENLGWWKTDRNEYLPARPVRINATAGNAAIDALITPAEENVEHGQSL